MIRDFNPDLTFSCAQHVSVILERKEEGFYFSLPACYIPLEFMIAEPVTFNYINRIQSKK